MTSFSVDNLGQSCILQIHIFILRLKKGTFFKYVRSLFYSKRSDKYINVQMIKFGIVY